MLLSYYAEDATSSCFTDVENEANSAYTLFEARQDDLFVIGRQGRIRHHASTIENDLRTEGPRDALDALVRDLLAD